MKRADCLICKGACCEGILLTPYVAAQFDQEWLKVRAKHLDNGWWELESKCPQLDGGLCRIYTARPLACQNYQVGGEKCLGAIIRRRPLWLISNDSG